MQRTLGNPFDDSITVDEALCDKPDPRFFPSPAAVSALSRDGDGLHDIHNIGVARQLGYTGGTLESEHTMPDYPLRHWPNWSTQFNAGITEMKHSV